MISILRNYIQKLCKEKERKQEEKSAALDGRYSTTAARICYETTN